MGKASGKLGILSARGRVSEGDSRKAYMSTSTPRSVFVLPVSPASAYTITGTVKQVPVTFFLDAVTLLSRGLWDKVKEAGAELTPWQGNLFVGVDRTPLQIHGTSLLKVWLGDNEFEIHCLCLIADIHIADGSLVYDFLRSNQCIVDTENKTLLLG